MSTDKYLKRIDLTHFDNEMILKESVKRKIPKSKIASLMFGFINQNWSEYEQYADIRHPPRQTNLGETTTQ